MSLDATIGGSSSNSYVTQQEADDYFAAHYNATSAANWAGLTNGQKESALKRACQMIDGIRVLDTELGSGVLPTALVLVEQFDLTIHRQMVDQVLNFPRNIDLDGSGAAIIPQAVKDAQCEQAVFLLAIDESALISRFSGITAETTEAGPIRIHQQFRQDGTYIAPIVLELMHPFVRPTRRVRRA